MFNLIIDFKRWRKVLENPVLYIRLSRENPHRVRYLEPEEIQKLLACCSRHLRPMVLMALHTGMRRGEILKLKWRDVDLSQRVIFVREAKSGISRYLPISDELLEDLGSQHSRSGSGYVFPSHLPRRNPAHRSGEPNEPYTDIKNAFRQALKKAGIDEFRFHDLRHTFASYLVMNGADLNVVRELLGHRTLAMTLRYAHLAPRTKDQAIRLIDQALGGSATVAQSGTKSGTGRILKFKTSG